MFLPVRAEVLGIEVHELGRGPRLRVDAVGDAGDGHLVLGHPGPHVFPQPLGHLAVELADAVRLAAGAQGEDGHGEIVGPVDRRLAEAQEILHVDADLTRVLVEIMGDEVARKRVVARRDRRVRREDTRRRDDLERGAEIEVVLADEMPRALQPEERGVALVHVVDRRFEAQRRQRAGPPMPSTISCRIRISRSPP